MNYSKPLNVSDQSAYEFIQEILQGDVTYDINFDREWDNSISKYVIVELLLCEESQKIIPFTSHPNRYFDKNARKFISLWEMSK